MQHKAILMSLDESVAEILSLIDRGDIDTAIDAVDQAQEEFGADAPYLVYAQTEIRYLDWRYGKSGDWKSAYPTYAESLLNADSASGDELALALKHYGHLLRFLYRDKLAIPILEALMAKECCDPQLLQRGYGPEGTWSLLAECFQTVGDSDASVRVKNMVSEQNMVFRDYWDQSELPLRDVHRKSEEEFREAQKNGSFKPMPNSTGELAAKEPDSKEEAYRGSDRPWWKFW